MKRLFAAVKIHPDPAFITELSILQQALSEERIKWVNPEQIHVTLKFFGETDEEIIPDISGALAKACMGTGPIDVRIQNAGIFGSRYKPRVIWFGIDDKNKLCELQIKVQEQLRTIGYVPDNQNFVPHLTIGRIKEISRNDYFQGVISRSKDVFIQKETIVNYHLFESKLYSHGPEYSIVKTFEF